MGKGYFEHFLNWTRIAAELGVDPDVILASSHGVRSIDTLRLYDPSKANWECKFPFPKPLLSSPSPLGKYFPSFFNIQLGLVYCMIPFMFHISYLSARFNIIYSAGYQKKR